VDEFLTEAVDSMKRHPSNKGAQTLSTTIIMGGSDGIARNLAQRFVLRGQPVVITSRDEVWAKEVAADIGGDIRDLTVDMAAPGTNDSETRCPIGSRDTHQ
jgi:short-subunit dehydrogenase